MIDIERLAREAGDDWDHTTKDDRAFIQRFADLVRNEVLEEAAKVCDERFSDGALVVADAIRALKDKT